MIKRERSALPLPRYVLRKRGEFLDPTAVARKNVRPKVPLSISTSGLDQHAVGGGDA
jgi:hypothetical protein